MRFGRHLLRLAYPPVEGGRPVADRLLAEVVGVVADGAFADDRQAASRYRGIDRQPFVAAALVPEVDAVLVEQDEFAQAPRLAVAIGEGDQRVRAAAAMRGPRSARRRRRIAAGA